MCTSKLRKAIEPWYVLGEEGAVGGTARYVDSSVERLQVKVSGMTDPRHCDYLQRSQSAIASDRRRRRICSRRPLSGVAAAELFAPDDSRSTRRWCSTCSTCGEAIARRRTYHVGHPGGLNPSTFPVNAFEAESRRAARFLRMGHRGGAIEIPRDEWNRDYPLTLDLRRGR